MLSFHCLQGSIIMFSKKKMNSNKYYITTSFIPCNTHSYSYVITVIVYQTYPYKWYWGCQKLSVGSLVQSKALDELVGPAR